MIDISSIYNQDCVIGMEDIDDNSLDAIITDPPFNISVKNNFNTLKGRKGIDFGEWDKEFDLTSWLEIALKKLKKSGNIIIFSAWRNMGTISNFIESNDCLIKEMIM
jgi:site-specific DNA-methyltransferase (adenine-specific)/modification methylase